MSGPARDDATREELDARLVRDVRQWRRNPSVSAKLRHAGKVDLDLEELDALLRTIDRLEAVKRELVDMPNDPAYRPKPIHVDTLPAGHAIIGGVVTPLPAPFDPSPAAVRAKVCTCWRMVRDARYRYGVRHEKTCALYHEPESDA